MIKILNKVALAEKISKAKNMTCRMDKIRQKGLIKNVYIILIRYV